MKLLKNKKRKQKPKYLMVTYSYVPDIPSVNLETGDSVKGNYLNIDSNTSKILALGKTTVILEYPKEDRRYSYRWGFPLILNEAGSFHKVTEYRQSMLSNWNAKIKNVECTSVAYGARMVYFNTFGLCNWKDNLIADFLGTDECQFLEYCALLKNISQKENQYHIFSARRIRRKFQQTTEIEILENDNLISFLIPCKTLNTGFTESYSCREGVLPNSFRDLNPSSDPNHLFVRAVISKAQYKRLQKGMSFQGWIFSGRETFTLPGIMINVEPVF